MDKSAFETVSRVSYKEPTCCSCLIAQYKEAKDLAAYKILIMSIQTRADLAKGVKATAELIASEPHKVEKILDIDHIYKMLTTISKFINGLDRTIETVEPQARLYQLQAMKSTE